VSLQVLPDDYQSIVSAQGYQSLGQEARGKGSKFQGMGMYAPLRTLDSRSIFFIKFKLKVPERTAAAPEDERCARETMMDAVQRAAHQRFWPTANSKPSVLYPNRPVLYADGPKQVAATTATPLCCC